MCWRVCIEDYDCVVWVMSEKRLEVWIDGNQIVCNFVYIIYSIVTLAMFLCISREFHSRWSSIDVTLLVLWNLPAVYLAAFRWTFSISLFCFLVCGDQMVEQYSRFDLTKGLVRSGSTLSQYCTRTWVIYSRRAVQVYTTAHCRFYIEQFGIAPSKVGPGWDIHTCQGEIVGVWMLCLCALDL